MGLNRIEKYLDSNTTVKCVVVSDVNSGSIHVTYNKRTLTWTITPHGIKCPGSEKLVDIHPLAAEALISLEIKWLLEMEGIEQQTIYISPAGHKTPITFCTPDVVETPALLFKKEKLKELYNEFIALDYNLTETIVDKAVDNNVWEPFLTLVNL